MEAGEGEAPKRAYQGVAQYIFYDSYLNMSVKLVFPPITPRKISNDGFHAISRKSSYKYLAGVPRKLFQSQSHQSLINEKLSFKIGFVKSALKDTPKRLKIITKRAKIITICIKPDL